MPSLKMTPLPLICERTTSGEDFVIFPQTRFVPEVLLGKDPPQ